MIQLKQILVPLDGSTLAEQALPLALSLVHQYAGQLILLSVTDAVVASQFVTHPEALQRMKTAMSDARLDTNRYLQAKQEELRQEGVDVQISSPKERPQKRLSRQPRKQRSI